MKKRLISILLLVLMVMSLFTGMSVSAYADTTVSSKLYTEYKLAEGDWVAKVCSKLGVNYYDVKEAIMLLNNITSEGQFSKLATGKVVKIPVSSAAAAQVVSTLKNVSSTTSTNGTASGSTITGTSSLGSTAPIAYYLISHTMRSGETVLGVCNSLGIDFTDNATQIKNINNIDSWTRVNAGKTILLPSVATPSVGTYCYAVLAHRISSGETAYTICSQNGINYNSNQKLLQNLNPATNLTNIKAGATLYVPVPTVINAVNNGGVNNPTTTPKPTATPAATPTPTATPAPTPTPAPEYNLNTDLKAADGVMKFYVEGKAVTTAAQGDKVTVEVTPASGKAVNGLTVKYTNGTADLKMNGNTFIMPACAVRVDADIQSGYRITVNSNLAGKAAATVNNINVTSAARNSSVKIVSTDPSYEIESLSVYTLKNNGDRDAIKLTNKSFVMPLKDVVVDVTLSPVKTYTISTSYAYNGSFDLQVSGNSVDRAAKGTDVSIVTAPNTGYEVDYIEVKQGSKLLKINNSKFEMPAGDVTVAVYFISKDNNIDFDAIVGGELAAYANSNLTAGKEITEAEEGAKVWVKAINQDAGYDVINSITVKKAASGGGNVTTTKVANGVYTFIMPRGGVNVSATLGAKQIDVGLIFEPATNGVGNSVTLGYNGKSVTANDTQTESSFQMPANSTLTLSTKANEAYSFVSYTILVEGVEDKALTESANADKSFLLPAKNVNIKAKFSAEAMTLPAASVTGPNGSKVTYQVSAGGQGGWVTTDKCIVNDVVKLVTSSGDPNFSAKQSTVVVTDNKNNAVEVTVSNDGELMFTMPKDGIKSISVAFVGTENNIVFDSVDTFGKKLVNMAQVNSTVDNAENAVTAKALSGSEVVVSLTAEGKSAYTIEKVDVWTSGHSYTATKDSSGNYKFTMVDEEMNVTVTLKAIPVEVKAEVTGSGTVKFYTDNKCQNEISGGKAVPGTKLYVKADAATGYKLKENPKATANNGEVVAVGTEGGLYTITVPASGVKVKAEFIPGTYALKIDFEGNAFKNNVIVVEFNGTSTELVDGKSYAFEYGTSLKFTAKADSGYNLSKLISKTDGFKDVTASKGAISFTMPAGLTANFELVAK